MCILFNCVLDSACLPWWLHEPEHNDAVGDITQHYVNNVQENDVLYLNVFC